MTPPLIQEVVDLAVERRDLTVAGTAALPGRLSGAEEPPALEESLPVPWRLRCGPMTDGLHLRGGLRYALALLGEAEQARTLGQDTMKRCTRVLGPDHPITLRLAHALDLLTSARLERHN